MGYAPNSCIVVEDSAVGVQAENAAGMTALLYAPHSTESSEKTATVFNDMSRLPELIKAVEVEKTEPGKVG